MHSGHPVVKQILEDWIDLVKLADVTHPVSKLTKERTKKVWELIERSAPIQYKKDVWIILRVLYNKVQQKYYLDVRAFQKKDYADEKGQKQEYFTKTDLGLNMEFDKWLELYNPITKMISTYKRKEKKDDRNPKRKSSFDIDGFIDDGNQWPPDGY